jgi:hypothetical protein
MRTPVKLSVAGPRLVPVLAPQPLPMPMEKWFEELETLSRVKEQSGVARGAGPQRCLRQLKAPAPKKDPNQ